MKIGETKIWSLLYVDNIVFEGKNAAGMGMLKRFETFLENEKMKPSV